MTAPTVIEARKGLGFRFFGYEIFISRYSCHNFYHLILFGCSDMQTALLPYWNVVLQQFQYAQFCSAQSLDLPVCHDFWMLVLFAVEAVGFLIFAPILYRAYQNHRGRKSYLKWLAAYEKVVDPEVMAKLSWKGHTYVEDDATQQELSEQIRLELEKRRFDLSS